MIYESGQKHNSLRFENLLISGDVELSAFSELGLFIQSALKFGFWWIDYLSNIASVCSLVTCR